MGKEYKIRTEKHKGITVTRSIGLNIIPEFYSYVFNEYNYLRILILYRGKYGGVPPIKDGDYLYIYYFYLFQHNIIFSTERLIRRKYAL